MAIFLLLPGLTAALLVVCVTLIIWKDIQMRKRYAHIPGPRGPLFIGNAFQINQKQPFKTFMKWKSQYGPVIFFSLFGRPFVIGADFKSIHEMLVSKGKEFGGRTRYYRDYITVKSTGMMRMDADKHWRDIRRLCHGSVKAFGPGMARIEHYAIQMMEEFVETFEAFKGEPVDPRDIFHHSILRMISLMVFGKKLEESSPICQKIKRYVHLLNESFHHGSDGPQLDILPFMRFFGNKTYKILSECSQNFEDVWAWYLNEVVPSQESDDILGKPVTQALMDGQRANGLSDQHIKSTTFQMTFAGIITTSTVLYHLILNLAIRPNVRKRMEEEIQEVIGERNVKISDRSKLPYTQAVLLEELRYFNLGSISLPHVAMEDTTLQGYAIPKATICFPLFMAAHTDEELWGDPWAFRPERFLDDKGEVLPANHPYRQCIFAFGQGTRVCAGELFAQVRLFLWVVSLVQKFDIQPDNSRLPIPNIDFRTYEDEGLVFHIPSYEARFIPKRSK